MLAIIPSICSQLSFGYSLKCICLGYILLIDDEGDDDVVDDVVDDDNDDNDDNKNDDVIRK